MAPFSLWVCAFPWRQKRNCFLILKSDFPFFFPKILFMIIWLWLNHAWQFPHNLSVTTLSHFTEVIAKHIAMQLFLSLLVEVLELWFNFLPSCLQFGTGIITVFAVVSTVPENGEETHGGQTFPHFTVFSLCKHHQSTQHG